MGKSHLIAFAGLALIGAANVYAAPVSGFGVGVKYNAGGGPSSIAEAATIYYSSTPDATDTPLVINYDGFGGDGDVGGGVTPPGYASQPNDPNSGVNHYVIAAVAQVTSAPGTYNLTVNSDDGFGFYVNNSLVAGFDGNRGPADSDFSVSLNTGDYIQLIYWENGGGDEVELTQRLDTGRALVNGAGSTLTVQTPEPASLGLLGLGAMGMLARRRRSN